jgi:hypothetical protein
MNVVFENFAKIGVAKIVAPRVLYISISLHILRAALHDYLQLFTTL